MQPASRAEPAEPRAAAEDAKPPEDWWAARIANDDKKVVVSIRYRADELVFVSSSNVVRIRPAKLLHSEAGRWEWRLDVGPTAARCLFEQESPWVGTFQCMGNSLDEGFSVEPIEDRTRVAELDRRVEEARTRPSELPVRGSERYDVSGVRVHFFHHAAGVTAVRGALEPEDAVRFGGRNAFVYTEAALVLVDVVGPVFTRANGTLSVAATMGGKVRLNKWVSLRNYFGEGDAITVPFLVYGDGSWCSSLHITATLTVAGRKSSKKVEVPLSCGE